MEKFIQKLSDLLRQLFPECEIEIEPASAGRVGGFLVWEGFAGREQIERQRQVWGIVRSALSRDDQLKVAVILTMTPEEMTAARAG